MTKEEALEFGKMWLEINEDSKDSDTYAFFEMAVKALELTKTGLLKDCESCKAHEQELCDICCNGNQEEKAKLCQRSFLAGWEHRNKQERP